jgi:glucan phosphoethanolaminetransferase (alkaline phosphatase superfamily)
VNESRPSETVSGFLAAFAIFASLMALAWHPLRLLPFAIVLALVSAAMGRKTSRLSQVAVVTVGVCFFAAMVITVVVQRPLW